ncbi:Putative ABC transporter [Acididesulfobacillus acetoxydans]|uniref:ABC transporter n=1 Tax=Acididesulfobacillus acetoxydans TaxID=1561005 RepID=A0A8S0X6K8_9FIRM|nr:ABC transporter ATP-binding protein [Acididesulfobacillus acetoxydans]CAA7602620.1 Putative ABC transporter [Acididesulfobacillus acetoxydans]CEJ09183.1 Spermidine/putrescine import ATP-binding protein PotA [Acididesulfobacillus acetoxydans]
MSPQNPAGAQTSTSVQIEHVTKRFGNTTAVNDVSLNIKSGEFMSLLGPSGCGKTTLLSMILGILDVTDGEISFNATRVDDIPMHKRDVGMVFQNYALFPHMSIRNNVGFGLDMRKVPKKEREKRVEDALSLVQLETLAERYPKQLSGGQQQRVALARALVVRPKVLLLDEPLSNLDAKLRKEMRIQLKRLHQDLGITTIYVTHDQEEALSLSTQVAVMSQGVVQQIGTPQEIFLHPCNQFVANFIGYANFFEGRLEGESGDNFIFRSEDGLVLATKKDQAHSVGDSVLLTIKPENIKLVEGLSGRNSVGGRVVVSDYVGNTTGYEVLSEFGDHLKVNVLGFESFPEGTELTLYLDPAHLLMVAKE